MKPQKEIKGITFFPVPDFSDASVAFGADFKQFFDRRDLPEVPKEYETMAQKLFFEGGNLPAFHDKVDPAKARKALGAWLGSWAPAHESKIATAAYALWLWTDTDALDS